jgi:hypothetical protein
MAVRFWQIVGFLVMLLIASTSGQTTPNAPATPSTLPVPQGWSDLVGKVSSLLCEDPAPPALSDSISDDIPIRELNSTGMQSRYRLQEKTASTTIVAAHAYAWPAPTVASDLAADIKQFDALPEPLRKQFALRDDTDSAKANTVAQQWLGGVLRPGNGQFVAVILLWHPPTTTGNATLNSTTEPKLPLFVLIKGAKGDDDQFHITQIAYGDADQALN